VVSIQKNSKGSSAWTVWHRWCQIQDVLRNFSKRGGVWTRPCFKSFGAILTKQQKKPRWKWLDEELEWCKVGTHLDLEWRDVAIEGACLLQKWLWYWPGNMWSVERR